MIPAPVRLGTGAGGPVDADVGLPHLPLRDDGIRIACAQYSQRGPAPILLYDQSLSIVRRWGSLGTIDERLQLSVG